MPTLPYNQTFTGPNNDPLPAGWVTDTGLWQLSSNTASNQASVSFARLSSSYFTPAMSANQGIDAIVAFGTFTAVAIGVRGQAAGQGIFLQAYNDGSTTLFVGSNFGLTVDLSLRAFPTLRTSGDRFGVSISGFDIEIFFNSVSQGIWTDTSASYATGDVFIMGYNAASVDDLNAYNVSGGIAPYSYYGSMSQNG